MPRTNDELLAHVSEMSRVALNSVEALAKAQRRMHDVYGNEDMEGEDVPELPHGVLGQEGYGGLGAESPRGIPRHSPVPSSGRQRLSSESDVVGGGGDGSTRASAALSRQLSLARAALKSTRRQLEQILDEEGLDDDREQDVNQETWPRERATHDDVMAGRGLYRSDVAGLLETISGRGGMQSLPTEKLSALGKSAMALCKAASARVDDACNSDSLNLNEQLACSTLLGYLNAAANGDTIAGRAFAEAYANADQSIKRLFDV